MDAITLAESPSGDAPKHWRGNHALVKKQIDYIQEQKMKLLGLKFMKCISMFFDANINPLKHIPDP